MDSEKQKDEVTALESIYNKEEFMYEETDGKLECTMNIFVPLPSKYYLSYKDTRIQEESVLKIPIAHLPPIILHASLPPNYPSQLPPKFILFCSWLQYSMISKLCQKLDQLWEENKEQEILFTWIGFLENETRQYLDIEDHLDISVAYTMYLQSLTKIEDSVGNTGCGENSAPKAEAQPKELPVNVASNLEKNLIQSKCYRKSGNGKKIDKRAVVDKTEGMNPVQKLIDYNEKRIQTVFNKSFYTCNVCFMEKPGIVSTEFVPCKHVFCRDCIKQYLEVKIKDGIVQNITCPEDKCTSEASPGQIKDLIDPELFAKYDSMLLKVTLEEMTDIIYCPRRHCQYPVSRESEEIMAYCVACQYAFCVHCRMVYHGIEPCKVNRVDKEKLVAEYEDASYAKKLTMEKRYGKRRLETLIENSRSENWIENNSKHCPNCKAAIQKLDGCNKVTCGRCNTYFCWICGVRLNPNSPYSHYRDPYSKCFNKLYLGLIIDDDFEVAFMDYQYDNPFEGL